MSGANRRKFPRLEVPIFYRAVTSAPADRRRALDSSQGGVRMYADNPHALGQQLELELFIPGHGEMTCGVEVVWMDALPMDAPARFEVGVKFVRISPDDQARLAAILKEP